MIICSLQNNEYQYLLKFIIPIDTFDNQEHCLTLSLEQVYLVLVVSMRIWCTRLGNGLQV